MLLGSGRSGSEKLAWSSRRLEFEKIGHVVYPVATERFYLFIYVYLYIYFISSS